MENRLFYTEPRKRNLQSVPVLSLSSLVGYGYGLGLILGIWLGLVSC